MPASATGTCDAVGRGDDQDVDAVEQRVELRGDAHARMRRPRLRDALR